MASAERQNCSITDSGCYGRVGAPLCRATADTQAVDGIEVVFKGGQIGGPDYFIGLRDGAA